MKLNNEGKNWLLLLCLVFVIVITAVFGIVPYVKLIDNVEEEQKKAEKEIARLKSAIEKEEDIYSEMAEAEEQINQIVSEYGSRHNVVSEIALIIDMEDKLEITIPTVSFGAAELIGTLKNLNIDKGSNAYMYRYPVSIAYRTTYEGIKNFSDYMKESAHKKNIESISMSYDSSTGVLSGAMVINLYSLDFGSGEYVESEFEDMPIGVENIFGTYK